MFLLGIWKCNVKSKHIQGHIFSRLSGLFLLLFHEFFFISRFQLLVISCSPWKISCSKDTATTGNSWLPPMFTAKSFIWGGPCQIFCLTFFREILKIDKAWRKWIHDFEGVGGNHKDRSWKNLQMLFAPPPLLKV